MADISHITDDTPIDLYQIEILHRLQTEGQLTFEQIFERGSGRLVMVGLFLGLLELVRAKLVSAEQPASASAIYLRALTDEPAEQAVQNAILAVGEADDNHDNHQAHLNRESPIPIAELPRQEAPAVSLAAPTEQSVVPIAEISSPAKPPVLQGWQQAGFEQEDEDG